MADNPPVRMRDPNTQRYFLSSIGYPGWWSREEMADLLGMSPEKVQETIRWYNNGGPAWSGDIMDIGNDAPMSSLQPGPNEEPVSGSDMSAALGKARYVAPVSGTWAAKGGSKFGAARGSRGRMHAGNDLQAANGSKTVASIGGKVIYAGHNDGYQWNAVVLGDDGNAYRYATHGPLSVKLGQRVEQGQPVGTIARGHLHFEVIPQGSPALKQMLAKPGQFVPTQWWPGKQPVTVDPAQFFGVEKGTKIAAGQAAGDVSRMALVPETPKGKDPFGVFEFQNQRNAPVPPAPPGTLAKGSTGAEVRAVQRQLKDAGFYKGKIDGDFGPKTEAALTAYQSANGMPVTGRIDDFLSGQPYSNAITTPPDPFSGFLPPAGHMPMPPDIPSWPPVPTPQANPRIIGNESVDQFGGSVDRLPQFMPQMDGGMGGSEGMVPRFIPESRSRFDMEAPAAPPALPAPLSHMDGGGFGSEGMTPPVASPPAPFTPDPMADDRPRNLDLRRNRMEAEQAATAYRVAKAREARAAGARPPTTAERAERDRLAELDRMSQELRTFLPPPDPPGGTSFMYEPDQPFGPPAPPLSRRMVGTTPADSTTGLFTPPPLVPRDLLTGPGGTPSASLRAWEPPPPPMAYIYDAPEPGIAREGTAFMYEGQQPAPPSRWASAPLSDLGLGLSPISPAGATTIQPQPVPSPNNSFINSAIAGDDSWLSSIVDANSNSGQMPPEPPPTPLTRSVAPSPPAPPSYDPLSSVRFAGVDRPSIPLAGQTISEGFQPVAEPPEPIGPPMDLSAPPQPTPAAMRAQQQRLQSSGGPLGMGILPAVQNMFGGAFGGQQQPGGLMSGLFSGGGGYNFNPMVGGSTPMGGTNYVGGPNVMGGWTTQWTNSYGQPMSANTGGWGSNAA